MNQTSGSELLERARPLFVGGCPRSGTTAFADYLNQHQEILLCQERYKGRQRKVNWDLFTFERIMDFRPEETKRPPLGQSLELFVKRHEDILARKDPTKLKWLGDKGPFYVRYMDRLAANNPGARFIMLYRPVEEIAESWDARAKDPDDPWRSERGYELSVEIWNLAMRGMRNFIESSPTPRVLIVSYHDFFYRNEAVVPQISRFLELKFDESVTRSWREVSLEFESERRPKESLSEEQESFIQKHADRVAEAWVLDRIEKQWREPGLYVVESKETALAALDETEARMWRLQQRLQKLEHDLARQRQEVEREHQRVARERQRDRQLLARERREGRRLSRQLEDMQSSRTWRLLNKLDRIRSKISVK